MYALDHTDVLIVEEIDIGIAELLMEPHECIHGENHSYEKFLMFVLHDIRSGKDTRVLIPPRGAFYKAIVEGDLELLSRKTLDES